MARIKLAQAEQTIQIVQGTAETDINNLGRKPVDVLFGSQLSETLPVPTTGLLEHRPIAANGGIQRFYPRSSQMHIWLRREYPAGTFGPWTRIG